MSLLLDALKKAAEKKARKAAEQNADAGHDKTETVTLGDKTAVTATEVDATRPMTDFHAPMDDTQTDATQVDSTRVDTTQIDSSEDATLLDTTQLEATEINSASDETLLETTQLEATTDGTTAKDSIGTDTTQLDATQLDATQLDATQLDATEIDKTALDATEHDTALLDTAQMEAAELRQSALEAATDDDDTVVGEGEEVQIPGDSTVIDSTQTLPAVNGNIPPPAEALTEDDVTDFMGDGYRDHRSSASDDTTLTNPESLTLTNFGYGDDAPSFAPNNDATETETYSLKGGAVPDATTTDGTGQEGLAEDDRPTVISDDSTSTTGARVDIEKLTSDETVTVEGQTSTRTFAPDNYDRTLINMSDKDVSRIFPGMKTESEAVMTPDYAKKVFLSKSGKIKAGYYKWYAGLALLLLLAVVLYGMFQLIDESEVIDQRLASLKRDPMPGMIKPKQQKPEPVLFATEPQQADAKTAQILAQAADEPVADNPTQPEAASAAAQPAQQPDEPPVMAEEAVKQKTKSATETHKPAASAELNKSVAVAKKRRASKPAAASTRNKTSNNSQLIISSNAKPSPRAQLLNAAYAAYQNGDMNAAARQYDRVLALDPVDRDALLGRAAVHIQQNEYQQAIDLYQTLLEQNPKDSMAMTSLISVANIDPQAAESQLKSMLDEQPDSPYLYFVLGNMYGSQQRWNEAQKAYFNALKLKPQDADYAYNLAVSLDHIGQKEAAVQFYRRALDFSRNMRANFDSKLVAERLEVLTQ